MAELGLCFCARAFSSCGKRGPLFIAVHGPLTIAASSVAEHRLQTRRLSSCGSRAQLFRGMWDLPRPGLEPVFPALAGRFSTTAPPGKPSFQFFIHKSTYTHNLTSCPTFEWLVNFVNSIYFKSWCYNTHLLIKMLISSFPLSPSLHPHPPVCSPIAAKGIF